MLGFGKRKGLGARIEGKAHTGTFGVERMRLEPVPANVKEFSLENFIPRILDQGQTSSCVAHAFAAAIHIAEKRAGLPFVPCSRLFAYYNARREQGDSVLTDNGTFLRTCAAGLSALGVPDEKDWPFTEGFKVNWRPSYVAYRQAQPRAAGQYVKIYQDGLPRLDAICQALYSGHAVAFGTTVLVSFLDMQGSPYIQGSDNSAIAGGHAMCIVGWKTTENTLWFRVQNSWGPGWRDKGLCWFHQDLLTNPAADDFHVIYGWNRLQQQKGG